MTYEEAKNLLKRHCGGCMHPQQIGWCKSHCEIGIAIESLEKQTPKKPVRKIFKERCFGNIQVLDACPTCGNVVEVDDNENYGHELYPACKCGQIIDWTGICDRGKWEDYEEVK